MLFDDVTVAMPTCDDDPAVLATAIEAVIAEPIGPPMLIVDMSHTDAIRLIAAQRAPAVQYVAFPESRGVSDSRNRLLELAKTRYVLFLDADARPQHGWLMAMRQAFNALPDIAIVGARCVPIWPMRHPALFETNVAGDFLSFFDLGEAPLDVPRIMGTSFAVDRERVGDAPFPVEVGRSPGNLLAGEEVALCETTRERGWRIRYEPSAVVGHHVAQSRATWTSMLRRVHVSGQEAARWGRRLEPLPRAMSLGDRAFLTAVAPWFLAGRLSGYRQRRSWHKRSRSETPEA